MTYSLKSAGRRRKRKDENHDSIVQTLRAIGCTVVELTGVGGGVPDLLVGHRGLNFLIEVKPLDGILRDSQLAWHASWRGQVKVARTGAEAMKIVGAMVA